MNGSLIMTAYPSCPPLAAAGISSVSTLPHFVKDGGWITWCILIPLSILTVGLAIHYLVVVRRSAQIPATMGRALMGAARQGQLRHLLAITRENSTMLGQAAYAGLTQLRAGRSSARAAIEEVVEERATKLFRRIEYLNVIGNVSPMIGLIGTVLGMIRAFSRISGAAGGMPEPGKLAGDISIALVTTFWGMLIAIPALTAHAIFRNRIDAFAAECVKLCDELISTIAQQIVKTSPKQGAKSPAPDGGRSPEKPEPNPPDQPVETPVVR